MRRPNASAWILRPLLLSLVVSVACAANARRIDEVHTAIYTDSTRFRVVEGSFVTLHREDRTDPAVIEHRFEPSVRGLSYFESNRPDEQGDRIELEGQAFDVTYTDHFAPQPETRPLAIDPRLASVYEIELGKRVFLCVESRGTGLFRSGTYQQIVFFQLFDVTDPSEIRHYDLSSRFGGRYSFGDLNGDLVLDFSVIRNEPETDNRFELRFLTLAGGRPAALTGADEEEYRVTLDRKSDSDRFRVIQQNLP